MHSVTNRRHFQIICQVGYIIVATIFQVFSRTEKHLNDMITVEVALYGELASIRGGKYIAQFDAQIQAGAKIKDLYDHLDISPQDRGYLFINAVLCDVPGLNAANEEPLSDGDHVGIFSEGYMWPYQYRDGAKMSESLQAALKEHGPLHHSYREDK